MDPVHEILIVLGCFTFTLIVHEFPENLMMTNPVHGQSRSNRRIDPSFKILMNPLLYLTFTSSIETKPNTTPNNEPYEFGL